MDIPPPGPSNPPELLPDICVLVVYRVFVAHSIITLLWTLLALPLYLDTRIPQEIIEVLFILSGVGFIILFIAILFVRRLSTNTTVLLLFFWTLCGSGLTGCIAAKWSHDAAPLQLTSILYIQSVIAMLYTFVSPRYLKYVYAFVYMACASIVAWSLYIVMFAVDSEWTGAIVVILLSLVCAGYNANQIRLITTVESFNVSWEDTVLAVTGFYGYPILAWT